MEHCTVLYIFDPADASNSVAAAIKKTGCEVVSTSSPTEGAALLYIMGQVAAVVLDSRVAEHAGFEVEQTLSGICPSVPVMIECGDQIDNTPTRKENCLGTDDLRSAIEDLLTANAVA
jgi:DNA-binding NtrC family response regulator